MNYTSAFFSDLSASTRSSAKAMVPWIIDLVRPSSVIDIGCGLGIWLREFHEHGIDNITGVDGPWVSQDTLEIPAQAFLVHDLSASCQLAEYGLHDLVLSLEVAEHLDSQSARPFVSSLVKLGPCILFSAAVPRQGGIGHVNEQWPSYWIKLFEAAAYTCLDCVRGRFWQDENVAPWYAQNTFVFVRKQDLDSYPLLLAAEQEYSLKKQALIHPRQYSRKLKELENPSAYSIKKFIWAFPKLLVNALGRRLKAIAAACIFKSWPVR